MPMGRSDRGARESGVSCGKRKRGERRGEEALEGGKKDINQERLGGRSQRDGKERERERDVERDKIWYFRRVIVCEREDKR